MALINGAQGVQMFVNNPALKILNNDSKQGY